MTGTFGLRLLDENPISTSYELLDISFSAGVNPGPAYQVVGSGTYRIGGEVAVLQDMFLDIEISNGFAKTTALCVNADRALGQQWPKVQINVDQTNGTPGQVYHLTLVAVPALKIHSIVPDHLTGDVHLEWEGSGGKSQLERATNSGGSYLPLTPITTNSSFTDVGVVTNHPQLFYRLHQF
jgi:hypothetical protein